MAQITISGKTVTVDDEFLNLPRDQQDAVVEDIAADMAKRGELGAQSGKPSMMDQVTEQAHDLRANQAPLIDAAVAPQEEGWETPGEGEPGIPVVTDFIRSLYPFEQNKETGQLRAAVPKIIPNTVDMAGRVLSLGKEVAEGELDPMSDEGIARGLEFTMMTTPGAPKVAKPKLPGNSFAVVGKTEVPTGIPLAAEVKTVAQKAYDQAKGSEIAAVVSGKSLGDTLTDVLAAEGLLRPDGKIQGSFSAVRTAMKDVAAFKGKPMTFEQFQRLEEGLQNVAASKNAGEARIGNLLLKSLDEYFEKLPDEAFTKTKAGAAATKEGYFAGKSGWALYSKLNRVEKAMAKAERAKGGFTEGLKSEFRKILDNDSKSRGYSAEELAMMDKFVKGGKLEAVSQWIGGLRGMVAGGFAGGVLGAGAMAVGGAMAKGLTTGGAKKTAAQLRASIASGGATLKRPAANPATGNTLSLAGQSANVGARALGGEEARQRLRLQAAAM